MSEAQSVIMRGRSNAIDPDLAPLLTGFPTWTSWDDPDFDGAAAHMEAITGIRPLFPVLSRKYTRDFTPERPCGARTRTASPCRSPAMPNGRCRLHGGASPGAPKGEANGSYRHGRFTCEAIERRRELKAWIRSALLVAQEIA